MDFWTPEGIKSAIGGQWLARGSPAPADGLSIDSRSIRPGQAFLCLRGERTDGHMYAQAALDAGARIIICDRPESLPEGLASRAAGRASVLHVPDTAAALLRLASVYRGLLDRTRVIAVGGSNGKTTTTRLIEAVLSTTLRGVASAKSFNNAVGVPLTILRARPGDQYLVCEVGTNAPGELAALTVVVRPDVAVITSIGREHLEGFGSLEGVAREEASLLIGLEPGGLAVVNADAPLSRDALRPVLASRSATALFFGTRDDADLRLTDVSPHASGVAFTLNHRDRFEVPLLGRHNAWNAAGAVAVARRLGIDPGEIARGLLSVKPEAMRLVPMSVAGVSIVNDAYNANPESMLAAIQTFAELPAPAGRRVVVLGDMLELGPDSASLHAEVARAAAGTPEIDAAVFLGPMMGHGAAAWAEVRGDRSMLHITELDEKAFDRAARSLRPGDAALLKGSRRTAVERLVPAIERALSPGAR